MGILAAIARDPEMSGFTFSKLVGVLPVCLLEVAESLRGNEDVSSEARELAQEIREAVKKSMRPRP